MGSSGDPSTNGIDPSVGGLVWVRRRNGSWWPGKIMGLDEVSEGCLVSPRLGTPVKLLGREDASVDWYNLEKSKRVKAFRCGDYDECIKKATASAENSSKKAVKYARREDAILHALELESAREPKDHKNLFSRNDNSDGEQDTIKETEHMDEESSGFEENSNSAQEMSHSSVSFEEPNRIGRRRTPNDSEDDGTEGIKRMRGLDDLGTRGEVSSLTRKRSQVGKFRKILKRKNRRRTLSKVLESTNMVSVPVMCEPLLISILESNESKRSFAVVNNNSDSTGITCENGTSLNASEHAFDVSVIKQKENEISSMLGSPENNSSDMLFDVPFVGDEMHHSGGLYSMFPSSSFQKTQFAGGQSSQSSQVETVSLGNVELNESGSTSSGAADLSNISPRREKETSKWQSKGKRNSRITTKTRKKYARKSVNACDESNTYQRKDPHMWAPTAYLKLFPDCPPTPKRSLPYRGSPFTANPYNETADFALRDYETGSLYDVNLEVKESYSGQHVPYISLMSKLSGQPIIGHPLTIEVLDDGFCDLLMNGRDCFLTSSSSELDDDTGENMCAMNGVDTDYKAKPKPRVSLNKSPKTRKNGILMKKIRKLSSLTGSHMQRVEEKKPIMVEKLKGPSVACVPLKVVFSRINAALNNSTRPSSRVSKPSVL